MTWRRPYHLIPNMARTTRADQQFSSPPPKAPMQPPTTTNEMCIVVPRPSCTHRDQRPNSSGAPAMRVQLSGLVGATVAPHYFVSPPCPVSGGGGGEGGKGERGQGRYLG